MWVLRGLLIKLSIFSLDFRFVSTYENNSSDFGTRCSYGCSKGSQKILISISQWSRQLKGINFFLQHWFDLLIKEEVIFHIYNVDIVLWDAPFYPPGCNLILTNLFCTLFSKIQGEFLFKLAINNFRPVSLTTNRLLKLL